MSGQSRTALAVTVLTFLVATALLLFEATTLAARVNVDVAMYPHAGNLLASF